MKKNLILIVTIIILVIILIAFIPSVAKGVRINRLQKELVAQKVEYARCEQVLVTAHEKANEVRAKLNEELWVVVFLSGSSMPETQSQTATLENHISGTKTENANQSQQ